jgi:plasmid stabilization system protein ParE
LALQILYSLRAKHEEIELLEYIVQNFGLKKAKDIYDRIEKVLEEISQNPEMFIASKKQKDLRKCVFSKQTSIYYRVNQSHLEVVSFRANKKDPDKFKV